MIVPVVILVASVVIISAGMLVLLEHEVRSIRANMLAQRRELAELRRRVEQYYAELA